MIAPGHLAWPEARELPAQSIGLITAGSIEQHRPQLPVTFDSLLVGHRAMEVA